MIVMPDVNILQHFYTLRMCYNAFPFEENAIISRSSVYLTIIPRAHVGYDMIDSQQGALSAEMAIIISYPTSASGIIVCFFLTVNKYC